MLKNALIIIAASVFLVAAIVLAYLWFFEDYSPFRSPIQTPESTPFISSPVNPTPFPTATIFPIPSDPGRAGSPIPNSPIRQWFGNFSVTPCPY